MENNNSFSPENFILAEAPGRWKTDTESIVSEAKRAFPERFEGNVDFFPFELRYTAPFEKPFQELKRLQGAAAGAAGRRDEFKGYIAIDLSSYLSHCDEKYLNVFLLFLSDMSNSWKYIFLIDNKNLKAAKELVGAVLSVFIHDNIPCEIREANEKPSFTNQVSSICRNLGVLCSRPVKEMILALLTEGFSGDTVSAFLRDVSWHCGKRISLNALTECLSGQESIIRFMLPQKEYVRFISIIEQQRENWYGKKEAI